jgi:hypothetical protein
VRRPGCSSRWRPRLERMRALCGPCVSHRGLSPSVCGRRTLTGLHIRDIGPRMLPSSAAPGRGACCRHPCCSFPCSALLAHMVLSSGQAVASTCATYVRLTSRFARPLHVINIPKLHTLCAKVPYPADRTSLKVNAHLAVTRSSPAHRTACKNQNDGTATGSDYNGRKGTTTTDGE